MKASISASVVAPAEADADRRRGDIGRDPIAASTWLGPTLPDEQAAPALTMTPSRSSAMIWVSADGAGHRDRRGVRQARRRGADHDRLGRQRRDFRFERVAQLADPLVVVDLGCGGLGGSGEAGDAGHILGAGAASALLSAAAQHRRQIEPAAHDQRADPRRAAELVRRQGQQIGADLGHVERHLAGRLHRVAMEERAVAHAPARAISATGCITPVSLLASMTETSAGRGSPASSAASASRSTMPSRSTGIRSASGTARNTESCSTADTSTRSRPAPSSARWFASVPPLTKTMPSGGAPTSAATAIAAALDELPRRAAPAMHRRRDCRTSASAAVIAAAASGRNGAVAFQSR